MRWPLALLSFSFTTAAAGQPVQTQAEAIADDAIQYAAQFGVTPDEGVRRLRAQQDSSGGVEALRSELANPLAGITIGGIEGPVVSEGACFFPASWSCWRISMPENTGNWISRSTRSGCSV